MANQPYYFEEFFASGKEESISPFLTPATKRLGKNLTVKSSIVAAFCLLIAFCFSFTHPSVSSLFLVFVYFLVGTPALINTLEDIRKLQINIDVLMTLAALLSVLINSAMEGALLLVLFEFSGAMENMVMRKTKSTLYALHNITPKKASVIKETGEIVERSIYEIPINSLILIKAGEIVPLDGVVIEGSSYVNMVHLTGESTPVAKKGGDELASGAFNLDGTLTLKVTRLSADSTVSRIIRLITQAQESKPKLESLLDRFGKWYAPAIILMAATFALTLPYLFSLPYDGPHGSIYRALTFLITASPCALIIATPTAYLSAISSCAKKGILLKGGTILDAVDTCDFLAFDKTGTLTSGELELVTIEPLLQEGELSPSSALQIAASLEKNATHPIGQAIVKKAKEQALHFLELKDFQHKSGYGLSAMCLCQGKEQFSAIGNLAFIDENITEPFRKAWQRKKETFEHTLLTACFLLVGGSVFLFFFKDAIRKEAKEAVSSLLNKGVKVAMLTGDHSKNARFVAKELNIPTVFSDLRPDDKLRVISELSEKHHVAMVGDGVNDAPALARASIGISMGKIGSSTAVDASDVVFLQDDLSLLSFLFAKAKATTHIIRENLFLSLGVILLATTPAVLGYIPLWLAVILHEGGTVLVGFNSLRLLKN